MFNIFEKYHFSKNRSTICSAFLVLLSACSNSNEAISNFTGSNNESIKDVTQEVTLFYSDNAKVKAILKAKELIRDASPEITYTDIKKGLKVEFLNDSQKVESTLTAINARIYDIEGNVIVRDSVKLINKKGEILKTEELVWNQKLDKFYTDKKVFIETTPGQVMHGDGLEANADFSWYKINNLKGVITVDNNLNP